MLRDRAIAWVKANCPNRKLIDGVTCFVDESAASGFNCWFLFGSGLTRVRQPYLVHCFGDELFIFQLTEVQAAQRGLEPGGILMARNARTLDATPAQPAVSIERFELKDPVVTLRQPIVARVQCELLTDFDRPACVRLDYALGRTSFTAWDYTERALSGKQTLAVVFEPFAPATQAAATDFRGPLAMFVHVVEMAQTAGAHSRRPLSNAGAMLVEVV